MNVSLIYPGKDVDKRCSQKLFHNHSFMLQVKRASRGISVGWYSISCMLLNILGSMLWNLERSPSASLRGRGACFMVLFYHEPGTSTGNGPLPPPLVNHFSPGCDLNTPCHQYTSCGETQATRRPLALHVPLSYRSDLHCSLNPTHTLCWAIWMLHQLWGHGMELNG